MQAAPRPTGGHADALNGRAVSGSSLTGRPLLRVGGCTRRPHGAGCGAGRTAPFNTMDRSQDRGAPPTRQPAPGASCGSSQRGFLPGVSTRPPPELSRDAAAASLHLAPGQPRERAAQVQRKCCRHRGKQWPRPFKTTRPLLPPPEPRRPSTASALPNWGQPLSDCTIFFAAHPGPRCRLTRQRAENPVPAWASHHQAPGARGSPR